LVGVHALEIFAVALAQEARAHMARGIAAGRGVLDLDDLGTEVGQKHRAVGTGAELLNSDDAYAFERFHGIGFRLIHCRAMMMRCISLVPSPMHMSGASR